MTLWAISDLHLTHPVNRDALEEIPDNPDDWLVVAGDVTNGSLHLDWCFRVLKRKFATVIWVPGNHELWSRKDDPRGKALYDKLVAVARSHDIITPEDPWPVYTGAGEDTVIAPLFLLYDYSFRPDTVADDQVIAWAREDGIVCADEFYLHPDPFSDRASWCAHLCARAACRLESLPSGQPTILVNHFPLEERHARLPSIPRFSPWCGTRRTKGWHLRYNARAVIYGHLHLRSTTWLDGIPFQEVSLGNPPQWNPDRGIASYLHEVVLAP